MAKVNFRQLKQRREAQRKKQQLEKQARRGRVPTGADPNTDPERRGPGTS
jgi:hypothetical protein